MNPEHDMTRNTRGFTLIELMVVFAIIVLLVTLVAVSLRSVRGSARRTVSLNGLKQIMVAYRSYSDDNRGQLLPGYIGANLFAPNEPFENLRVILPDGTNLQAEDKQSYVWRLAPYVDNAWEVFYTELRDESLMAGFDPGDISERPTYGLNSIFVGGDSVHGGTSVADQHPWQDNNPVIGATRFTQVKNPARLIVFGATAKADASGAMVYDDESLGFCEVRPPYLNTDGTMWIDPQWKVAARGLVAQTGTGFYGDPPGAGLPIVRNGNDVIPVGMLDGSTAAEQLSNLARDMRRWSPFEVALRETQ
jgi:prepilin-type N-terminal cleavage/methylation domain-containing protein